LKRSGKNKKSSREKSLIFTRETLGVVLVLFSTLSLVCLITRDKLFSGVGQAVNAFLFGCFGFFAYAVLLFIIGIGIFLISEKPIKMRVKHKVLITLGFIVLATVLQIVTAPIRNVEFNQYISNCYQMGQDGISTASAGGVASGVMAFGCCAVLTDIGSYVVLGLVLCGIVYLLVKDWVELGKKASQPTPKFRGSFVSHEKTNLSKPTNVENVEQTVQPEQVQQVDNKRPRLFVNNPQEFAFKNKREIQREQSKSSGMKMDFSQNGFGVASNIPTSKELYENIPTGYQGKLDYIKTPTTIDMNDFTNNMNGGYTNVSAYVSPREEENQSLFSNDIPMIEHDNRNARGANPTLGDCAEARAERFEQRYFNNVETERQPIVEDLSNQVFEQAYNFDQEQINLPNQNEQNLLSDIPFIQENNDEQVFGKQQSLFNQIDNSNSSIDEHKQTDLDGFSSEIKNHEQPTQSNIISNHRIREIFDEKENKDNSSQSIGYTSRVEADSNQSSRRISMFDDKTVTQTTPVEKEKVKKSPPINRRYYRPPFELLEDYVQPMNAGQENHEERKKIIQRTLEEFHINAVPQGHIQGPSVTRYEIMMPAGISVKKVLNYDDDLKMRLSAKNGVRIEAPIPGKNLVGIEVANTIKVTVGLKEVMQGLANKKSKPGSLMFALGKDIVGNAISDDLTKGPHFLIAGATGSGKSVCLHVMIVSLLMRYSPEELKLVLVDPKSVEFRKYEHIPHLLVDEIITEPKRALTLLQWAYDETNRRNELFTASGGHISNIDDYNAYIANGQIPKLPRIVFVIDELADLMEACKKDLEARIRMIAAKSRSAGIHLVLATQRPSVDVITGTIKANLPSRIALKVMNFADSQTILSEAGAEKLLGNGDMLYKNSSMGENERYQGAYISGREISNVVNYIKEKNTAYFDEEVKEFLDRETRPKQEESSSYGGGGANEEGKELDELFLNALWTGVNSNSISISSLQRRFQIGYARAGGLVDKMEQMGFVSPYDGSKARKVLLTKEEFIEKFGPRDEAY